MRHASAPPAGITFALVSQWRRAPHSTSTGSGPCVITAFRPKEGRLAARAGDMVNVKSRPAQVGDKLETCNFGTGTTGFCAAADRDVAVCLLPGTEIAFDDPARKHPFSEAKTFDKVAIFRQFHKDNPHRHHDFLEFPNGEVELLTLLAVNQRATVLQLPAAPKTEAEREDHRRAEYAG